ncbi:MAG: PIN domain-containing protein [Candidatus Methanofastidiosia archaeon]|jgi:rRNA-processing protein FCF1
MELSSNSVPVILDTNFILSCYHFGIPLTDVHALIDERHQIVVPQNVLQELKSLKLTGKDKEARKIMLTVLQEYPVFPLTGPVDTSLIKYAQDHPCIICTNDKPLRKVLKSMGVKTILVRSRSHLAVE